MRFITNYSKSGFWTTCTMEKISDLADMHVYLAMTENVFIP